MHYQKRNKSLRRHLSAQLKTSIALKVNASNQMPVITEQYKCNGRTIKKLAIEKKTISSFSIINFLNRSAGSCFHNLA